MQSSSQELGEYCKKIEDDLNRKIFSKINSLTFILAVVEIMENYLEQLTNVRKASEQLSDLMGLPTRDDFANIASKLIEYESRLDNLEDEVYQMSEAVINYRNQLAGLGVELGRILPEKKRHARGIDSI